MMQESRKRGRRLLSKADLKERGIGYSDVHLWRLEREGKFPKRVRLGSRCSWVEDEIDAWIDQRINERDEQTSAA